MSTPTSIPATHLCASEILEGTQLANGWRVTEKVEKHQGSTGGFFSVPYFVERTVGRKTQRAFLKALNFRVLAGSSDFARDVQRLTAAFNFERDTLTTCNTKGLSRIARILDSGQHLEPNSPYPVCYIIFELAELGDARKQLAALGKFELAWTLRTLHEVSVALSQLHRQGYAHQDLKPSNVLFFEAFGAKIGDLGCADDSKDPSASPRGAMQIAGDSTYAPPELFYGEIASDWRLRRLGCDLYLMGSLVAFFFTGGVSMTALWMTKLAPAHKPVRWTSDYRTVLPYVRDAFEQALEELKPSVPQEVRSQVFTIIRFLCEPDPKLRGHPKDLGHSQFNLERVISEFDLLATKAEYDA